MMYRHSLVHVLLLFQQQNEEEFDSDKGLGPSSEMKPISNEADTIDLVHPFSIERANVVRWEGKEASRLQALVYNIPAMLGSHTGCYPSLIVLKKQIIEVNSIKLICQTHDV